MVLCADFEVDCVDGFALRAESKPKACPHFQADSITNEVEEVRYSKGKRKRRTEKSFGLKCNVIDSYGYLQSICGYARGRL